MRPSLPLIIISFAIPSFAGAVDNVEISRKDVPAAVLKTAQYYAPDITFTRIGYEDENGQRVYEFEGHSDNGRHVEIDVFPDGTLEEIEIEKYLDEVPVPVRIELELSHPDFTPKFTEMSARPDGTIIYEFEGVENGNPLDIEIMDNGRTIQSLTNAKTTG